MRRVLILSIAIFALATIAGAEPAPLRVLFLGNSLTYVNDLPQMVEALAAHGARRIETGMIAGPNYGLEDLWRERRVHESIRSGRWDVVVMQQGPSALPESRVNLVAWTKKFGDLIREHGAEPALYMVWPSSDRAFDRQRVAESYRVAAEECRCRLLPAGEAWQAAWKKSGRVSLYGADGFHPSSDGTFLAAVVIWSALTGEPPERAPGELKLRDGTEVRINAKVLPLLTGAAKESLK